MNNNFSIRQCTSSVKAAVAVERVDSGADVDSVLQEFDVSTNPYNQAKRVKAESSELFAKVIQGELAVGAAIEILRHAA